MRKIKDWREEVYIILKGPRDLPDRQRLAKYREQL
jgi:hypothetical protein